MSNFVGIDKNKTIPQYSEDLTASQREEQRNTPGDSACFFEVSDNPVSYLISNLLGGLA